MAPNDRIDSLIDETAARLTAAEPSRELRARVMTTIASGRAPRAWWRFALAGGAMIGAIVIGIVSLGAPHATNPTVSNPAISNPTILNPTILNVATAHPTAVTDVSSPVMSIIGARRALKVRTASDRAAAAAELEWHARATPALARPDALEVSSLEVRSIDITPLGVAPLVVPALGEGQNR